MAITIQITHDHGQVENLAKDVEKFIVVSQSPKGTTAFKTNIQDLGLLNLLLDVVKDMILSSAKGQGGAPKGKVIPVKGAIPGLKVHKP